MFYYYKGSYLMRFVLDKFFDTADDIEKAIVVIVTNVPWNKQTKVNLQHWFKPSTRDTSLVVHRLSFIRW